MDTLHLFFPASLKSFSSRRTVWPAVHWMELCLCLIYSNRLFDSVCLVARGINKSSARQTHLVKSQMSMESFLSVWCFRCLSSFLPFLPSCKSNILSGHLINCHYLSFQPNLSSCPGWAAGAPGNGTHLLLGCQAGQRAAVNPFNLSLSTNTPAKDCLHSHLCLLSALRCSRRCGGHRARRPHRSSRSWTWASLVTPHSCTASARGWWTRTRMRWGLRFYALTHDYIVLFCLYERFLCFLCFVFRSRPSEMETRKFWTSWWGWFRRRPKGGPTRFRWGQFYKSWLHEGWTFLSQIQSQIAACVTFMKDKMMEICMKMQIRRAITSTRSSVGSFNWWSSSLKLSFHRSFCKYWAKFSPESHHYLLYLCTLHMSLQRNKSFQMNTLSGSVVSVYFVWGKKASVNPKIL